MACWRCSLCAAFNVLMTEGEQRPKLMTVGLHSRISGHPARADVIYVFWNMHWLTSESGLAAGQKLLVIGSNALAIQMIINQEWGLAKNENHNQGAFIITQLTDWAEQAV